MITHSGIHTPNEFPNLVFILFSVVIIGISIGMFLPLTSIIFNRTVFWDVGIIPGNMHTGFVVGTASLATVIFPFFIPLLIKRFDLKPVFVTAFIINGIVILLHLAGYSLFLWYILRFLFGVCFVVILVASETYITVMAPQSSRSKILSYYGASLALGIAIGVATSSIWLSIDRELPFLLSGGLSLVSGFLLLRFLKSVPFINNKAKTEWSFLKHIPIPLFASFIYGFLETSFTGLLPGYILEIDDILKDSLIARWLSITEGEGMTSLILPFFVLGGILMQIPIGRIATHSNKRYVMIGLAVLGIACFTSLVLFKGLGLLCVLGFLAGGAIMSFYVVGLSMIGDECTPDQLPSANSLFVLVYGIGCMMGPWLNGPGIEQISNDFILYSSTILLIAFLILSIFIIITHNNQKSKN